MNLSQTRFRSGLERQNAQRLLTAGCQFRYEEDKVSYLKPAKPSKYLPDFRVITKSGKEIIVETKGRFETQDRQKHLLIKEQHPDLDIRFVFSNSRQRISKTSKTTYGMWCESKGFLYADKFIPEEWLNE